MSTRVERVSNWLKANLLVLYAREGLQDFVYDGILNLQQGIGRNIANEVGLPDSTICTWCFTQNVLSCPTEVVCKVINGNCTFHTPGLFEKNCSLKICNKFCNEIRKMHRYGNPSWKNTRTQLWSSNAWEVAKCFMPPEGYYFISTIDETDFNGIINVILNCTEFQSTIEEKLDSPNNLFRKADDLCNKLYCCANLELEDLELMSFFTVMKGILSDPKTLRHDIKAQEALGKLIQLQNSDQCIPSDALKKVLQNVSNIFLIRNLSNVEHGKAINMAKRKLDEVENYCLSESANAIATEINEMRKQKKIKLDDDIQPAMPIENGISKTDTIQLPDFAQDTCASMAGEQQISDVTTVGASATDTTQQNIYYKYKKKEKEEVEKEQQKLLARQQTDLSDKDLADISYLIGNGWEYLAAHLNVSRETVKEIDNYHKLMQAKIYNMLLKWRDATGCEATSSLLFETMTKAQKVTIEWEQLNKRFEVLANNEKRMLVGDQVYPGDVLDSSKKIRSQEHVVADLAAPKDHLSEKELLIIADHIGEGWEILAFHLDIMHSTIDQIKEDYKYSMKLQIFHMLLKWRASKGSNATISSLFTTMWGVKGIFIEKDKLKNLFKQVVDYDQLPCSTSELEDNYILLQKDLLMHYQMNCSKLQISPLFDEEEYSSSLQDVYVPPTLTFKSHTGMHEQTVCSYHDIFIRDKTACKQIYISAPAGCGKTSFVKRMALLWCQAHGQDKLDWCQHQDQDKSDDTDDIKEMQKFQFLFVICLRVEHQRECKIVSMILKQLLEILDHSSKYANSEFIEQLLSDRKCLIVLDGLDEWSHPQKSECRDKQIPHRRTWPNCTILTTSRPWKLDIVKLASGPIYHKLELNGLEGDLLKKLINNVVTKMNTLYEKNKTAREFQIELIAKKLTTLSRIPFIAMQLLTLWFDDKPIGHSQCTIYHDMLEFLFKHYEIREIAKNDDYDSINGQDAVCCNDHTNWFSKLGKLAFYTLFTDNEESLVFSKNVSLQYISIEDFDLSCKLGILTQEKVMGKLSERNSNVSFLHKTFQEYLATLYLAQSLEVADIGKVILACSTIEKILEMSQIFLFISGLCPKVMSHLCEHIRSVVSADGRIQKYRSSCELHWGSSEQETLRHVQVTMIACLHESRNNKKNVLLPLNDYFIDFYSPPLTDWLKDLVVNNNICTLFINDWRVKTCDDFLDSAIDFSLIQKLELVSVPEIIVSRLVSKLKGNLKCLLIGDLMVTKNTQLTDLVHLTELRLGAGVLVNKHVVSPAQKDLHYVSFWKLIMSGDVLCSFVDSILQLSKPVNVKLWDCSIREGNSNWKSIIRSHPGLEVYFYNNDDVSNDRVCLNIHTTIA